SAGLPTHLTREEEAELQAHNRAFQITSPAAEIFWEVFRLPHPEEECPLLSATEIFRTLQRAFPSALRGMTPNSFGRILRGLGLKPFRTSRAMCYRVVLRG
ncbi:helicase, partial [Alloprevotella sp. OH1205_COT-284]|uniref:DUF3874 domain-containing protein n=1 Tax=Alloprevotella sp. OH1205_COT-284 TaxID=2491043 RepID=UPI000F9D27C1